MRSNQHILRQLNKAIVLIEQRLQSEQTSPTLCELADTASISRFHFHRIYRLLLGETCQQTITRLQMLKAANALKDNSVTITEIALQAGFSSSQAFAKVIKRELGTTASNLRADPEQLSSILLKLNAPLNPENPQASPFEVRLTSLAPFQMVAVSTDNRYPNLNELYAQLFELAGGPENVAAILGLAYGDIESGEKEQSRFDCGVLLRKIPDTLPEPFIEQPNPEQRYAVLRHQGSYQDLAKIIDDLYLVTLRDDQQLPADKPCLLHYLDDPELTEENALRTDIYLPVNEILN